MKELDWNDPYWRKRRNSLPDCYTHGLFIQGTLIDRIPRQPSSFGKSNFVPYMEDIMSKAWNNIWLVEGYESFQDSAPFYKAVIDVRMDQWGWGLQFAGNGDPLRAQLNFRAILPLDEELKKTRSVMRELLLRVDSVDLVESHSLVHMDKNSLHGLKRVLSELDKDDVVSQLPSRAVYSHSHQSLHCPSREGCVAFLRGIDLIA